MGMGGRADHVRVLAVYGSESGNSKRNIERIVRKWSNDESAKFKVEKVITGKEVGSLDGLSAKYDVILIATSSFGEGDPPDNYADFLSTLYTTVGRAQKPLAGMQHAVLGFGDSVYDTFQNCPRLTDMLMAECGSRRLAQRAENDESAEDSSPTTIWAAAVYEALQNLPPADSPPVCDWTVPAGKTLDKEEDLSTGGGGEATKGLGLGAALILLVAVTLTSASFLNPWASAP